MGRLADITWLASVSILLIVVLGSIESGHLAGVRNLNLGQFYLNSSLIHNNATEYFGIRNNISRLPPLNLSAQAVTGQSNVFYGTIPAWYVYVLVVAAGLGAGLILFRRRGKQTTTYDLSEVLKKLEGEKVQLGGSTSYKLRNAALLRYYSLMRQICAGLGLEEVPAETPTEYISRVSKGLKIDGPTGSRFAQAFNRARYGEELSEKEIGEASAFMSGFIDGIKRGVEVG